jgi:hypothetical protein
VSLAERLRQLPPDPRVVISGNHATPWHTLALVDAALPSYRLWVLNGQPGLPDRDGVVLETPFVGPGMRRSPRLSYLPSRLSLVPTMLKTVTPPDLVVVHTTPPRGGKVSLGTEVNVLPAAIEAARERGGLVVAQVNEHLPWTYGDGELDLDLFDELVEAAEPLAHAPSVRVDEESARIGALVADRVPDGATLQAGIGAVPDATMMGLTGRRGLRIWTEMFSDSVLTLERAGALDPAEPITASFLFGSEELLKWVHGNERVRLVRTEVTNDPGRIARNRSMVSINTAPAPHPLRLRRPDRLHRGRPPQPRRPGGHRAALLAPQGRRVDDRAAGRRTGDVLPDEHGGHRAGAGADLRQRPARAGSPAHRARRPPRRTGRAA